MLVAIGEPRNNDLRVVVMEMRAQAEAEMTMVGLAHPVGPDETCRVFELNWHAYVAYAVRNESYFRAEDGASLVSALKTRANSAFLKYVASTTFATNDFPGPLTHWSIYTEWQCIDVVGVDAPDVRELEPAEIAVYRSNELTPFRFDGATQSVIQISSSTLRPAFRS